MLELTGVAGVLRGISVLYWLLAIGAISLAVWEVKGPFAKAIWHYVHFGLRSVVTVIGCCGGRRL